jgi:hypothetical protein
MLHMMSRMKTTLSVLSFLLLASACSSSSVSTTPLADGGTADSGGGGSSECPAGTPTATFQLNVVGDTRYCDGSGCDASFLTVTREDGTPVVISGGCITSCSDCQPIACSAACRAPSTIGATGLTSTWTGTIYETSTCGEGTQCAKARCVAAGTYVAHMCGYAALDQDAGAGVGVCQAATTTATCADVTFTWPPTGPVTGTIGTK